MLISDNFMLIYVNITDRQTDRQTHQKYSSEPHKKIYNFEFLFCDLILFIYIVLLSISHFKIKRANHMIFYNKAL